MADVESPVIPQETFKPEESSLDTLDDTPVTPITPVEAPIEGTADAVPDETTGAGSEVDTETEKESVKSNDAGKTATGAISGVKKENVLPKRAGSSAAPRRPISGSATRPTASSGIKPTSSSATKTTGGLSKPPTRPATGSIVRKPTSSATGATSSSASHRAPSAAGTHADDKKPAATSARRVSLAPSHTNTSKTPGTAAEARARPASMHATTTTTTAATTTARKPVASTTTAGQTSPKAVKTPSTTAPKPTSASA